MPFSNPADHNQQATAKFLRMESDSYTNIIPKLVGPPCRQTTSKLILGGFHSPPQLTAPETNTSTLAREVTTAPSENCAFWFTFLCSFATLSDVEKNDLFAPMCVSAGGHCLSGFNRRYRPAHNCVRKAKHVHTRAICLASSGEYAFDGGSDSTLNVTSDLAASRKVMPSITRFESGGALADAVAGMVATAITQGIHSRGRARLVFSGGSTPEIFLPLVACLDVPWEKVDILLADERWVDESSTDSNTAMLRRTLIGRPGPDRARFIPLKNGAQTAMAGADFARANLPPIAQRHELVLLGMGNDGHIASLFPGNPQLPNLLSMGNRERVAAVPAPATASPHVPRITLTLAELRNAVRIVLVLQGVGKLDVLHRAWEGADTLRTPVFALGNVEVLWCP